MDIIRIQACHFKRKCHVHVAEGGLTSKLVDKAVLVIVIVDEGNALGDGRRHGVIGCIIDNLDSVSLFVRHFCVPLVLLFVFFNPFPTPKHAIFISMLFLPPAFSSTRFWFSTNTLLAVAGGGGGGG